MARNRFRDLNKNKEAVVAEETKQEEVTEVTPVTENVETTEEEVVNEQPEVVVEETKEEVIEEPAPVVEETKPEVTETPVNTTAETKEETPVVEEVKVIGFADIPMLLGRSDIGMIAKFELMAKDGDTDVKKVVSKLLGFHQETNTKAPFKGIAHLAGKNYDLFNTIKSVLEIKDQNKFKASFDLVNLFFKTFAKDSYNEFRLRTGVESWKWGETSFKNYSNLVTVICVLCDAGARKKNIKKIDFVKLYKDSAFTPTMEENLTKYYNN
jgi:hypothetical protein